MHIPWSICVIGFSHTLDSVAVSYYVSHSFIRQYQIFMRLRYTDKIHVMLVTIGLAWE